MNATTTEVRYDSIPMPDVTIGNTTFKVEVWHHEWIDHLRDDAHCMSTTTVLTGPRGAQYQLAPLNDPHDGVYAVVSLGSGRELRVRGNAVRVVHIGDVIEAL